MGSDSVKAMPVFVCRCKLKSKNQLSDIEKSHNVEKELLHRIDLRPGFWHVNTFFGADIHPFIDSFNKSVKKIDTAKELGVEDIALGSQCLEIAPARSEEFPAR